VTILFISFPFIVCLWNSYTDVGDLLRWAFGTLGTSELLISTMMIERSIVSAPSLTWLSAKLTRQSSILLNGWYLASKFVWEDDWDETNDSQAPKVRVSRIEQTAKK
jgi:hypothetical protein